MYVCIDVIYKLVHLFEVYYFRLLRYLSGTLDYEPWR